MKREEFFERMQEKSSFLGVRFCVKQLEQFFEYMELLIEWNEKINLTAIIEPEEIILKHFIDSITILKDVDDINKKDDKYRTEKEIRVVDVGTGAGFPGIPLSIMKPTLKITLVDSLNKRLIFLQEVVNKLQLKNIEKVLILLHQERLQIYLLYQNT